MHKDRAYFHSPLSFLKEYQKQLSDGFLSKLSEDEKRFRSKISLFIRRLEWDSNYFNVPVYKLEFADWDESVVDPTDTLAQELKSLKLELSYLHDEYYLFSEIPSEDLTMLQAASLAGYRLVETRITYFCDDLQQFNRSDRFNIRLATQADIPSLRKVAMEARNSFDKYHADPFFTESVADEYLAVFIENSVNGFADIVIVPAENAGAFFTANIELSIGKIVLTAVSKECKGWHFKLLAEMSYLFKERGIQIAYMITQSTNRSVIRNCEKLGYRYGRCTHVFSTQA